MESKFIFLLFFLSISIYQIKPEKISTKEINSNLLEWGLKNNFTLPPNIEISSEKDPKFISKSEIKKNETILIIPYNLMFTVDKALKLIASKKLRKQFHQLKTEEFIYIEFEDEEYRKEEAFLAYILYLMEFRPKKYQKTLFYEEYKYYLESLKIEPRIKPLFFDNEGCEKLYMTYVNTLYKSIKKNYEEEIFIFKGETYNKKDIDYDDYLPHRINVHNKGMNIFRHKHMVPFFNYFDTDYINYNANYKIEEDGSIRIYAKKNINKYDEIIIKSPKMTNARYLLFKGKTYDKLINYYDEYLIPAFGVSLYYRFDIQDPELEDEHFINLMDKDFDEDAIEIYRENKDVFKDERNKNGTTYGFLYEILMNNIKTFKEYLKDFNLDRVYEYFEDVESRNNIARIVKGEAKIVEQAYGFVRKKAKKYFDVDDIKEEDIINRDL